MSDTATRWASPDDHLLASPRPRRWLFVAGTLLLVFVSGGVAGSSATMMALNRGNENRLQPFSDWKAKVMNNLSKELDLSSEQFAQVEQIMEEHYQAINRIREANRPLYQQEFKRLQEQVAGVLSAEQQEKWRDYMQARANRCCPPGSKAEKKASSAAKNGHGT